MRKTSIKKYARINYSEKTSRKKYTEKWSKNTSLYIRYTGNKMDDQISKIQTSGTNKPLLKNNMTNE